ncbi:MAG: hypothetical protein ACOVKS_11120 [Aquimonas sp.]|jgi:hypothetical protein
MIERTLELADSPDALRVRLNAIASPRRGLLHSPDNRLEHHRDDPAKPFRGHWAGGRFRLQPQAQSQWRQTHLWSPCFDGEVHALTTGCRVWIRASFGLYATSVYGGILILLTLMGVSWSMHSPLEAGIPFGLAAALACGLRMQLSRALARLVGQLAP